MKIQNSVLSSHNTSEANVEGEQKRLKESEQRFGAAMAAVQGILWTNNAAGEMEGDQPGWEQLTGQSYSEYQGYGWAKAVHPDDRTPTIEAWQKAVEAKSTFIFEHRVKAKDGVWHLFSIRAVPVKNDDGSVREWVGVHTDITEQRKAENNLQESEAQLRNMVLSSPVGMCVINASSLITEIVNESFLELVGKSSMEMVGQPYIDFFSGAGSFSDSPVNFVVTNGKSYLLSEVRLLKEGMVSDMDRYVTVKYLPLTDQNGGLQKVMIWVLDNTDQVSTRHKIEESEKQFRLLAETVPQLVWIADANGNLYYYNQATFDYSGLTMQEMRLDGWLMIVHPEDKDENVKQWLESIAVGKDFNYEHRLRRYDDEYRWHLSRAVPYRDSSGNIVMWVGSSTDIQQLKEEEKRRGDFIKMVSHELKTPVTSIKGYVQLLLTMLPAEKSMAVRGSALQPSLERVDRQVSRLTRLITEMLDLNKLDENKLELKQDVFSLYKLVAETIADILHTAATHPITITTEADAVIVADRDRIQQVLINFINNAIKYSPAGREINVHLNLIDPAHIAVSIQDYGLGINKADHKRIFDRFYRVSGKNEKTYSGLGIGLFISNQIIERHKGTIKVESEPGIGSTFTCILPLSNTSIE